MNCFPAEPEDRGQVAQADLGCRSTNRAEGCKIHDANARRGGDYRRFPAAHAVAAGRLPLCVPADDPAPDAIVPQENDPLDHFLIFGTAPLFAAARHQPIARGRWRQACEAEIQGLPARLLPRSLPGSGLRANHERGYC